MEIKEYIIRNECLEIHVCNPGGIIKNLFTRNCRWKPVDVVLGFDTAEQYSGNHPYFGAINGRYGNRVKNTESGIDGQQ